jgi:hypothetical protein
MAFGHRPEDNVLYRVGVRDIDSVGVGRVAGHKLLQIARWTDVGGDYAIRTGEMAPGSNDLIGLRWNDSDGGLTQATVDALNEGRVAWGEWSSVKESALTANISAYEKAYVNTPYRFYRQNSNHFVNEVVGKSGGNPHVPGRWAPAFNW